MTEKVKKCEGCGGKLEDRYATLCPDCGRWSTVSIRARTRLVLVKLTGSGWSASSPDDVIYKALVMLQEKRKKEDGK